MNQNDEFNSVLTKNQKKKVAINGVMYEGEKVDLLITIRYDDDCGNGHNSFSITGDIYKTGKRSDSAYICGGCVHEAIETLAPEYAKYIKYHLMSSDEPLHYVSNTLYHALDKDCWGYRKGEVSKYETTIKFKVFPMSFKLDSDFIDYLKTSGKNATFDIEEIPHKDKDGYKYASKYTFKGYVVGRYKCPFDTLREAQEWKEALSTLEYDFIQTPTQWGEGKEPNLEAARESAKLPNATLEQLQDKDFLMAQLPRLRRELKAAVEELGFIF
jgi:hypothetical protein